MASLASHGVPNVSAAERFVFDVQGYLHLRDVLSPAEVEAANDAINGQREKLLARNVEGLSNVPASCPLSGGARLDMGGMLGWPPPQASSFRKMLCHPRLVPYLNELLGEGYRLDHQPLVIASEKGGEGFSLHGGPLDKNGKLNRDLQYRCEHGAIHNSLLAVSFQLVDHNPGDGGFCVLPGSHKMNFPVPEDLVLGQGPLAKPLSEGGLLHVPATKAGDVILFSEATVHGAVPWKSEQQRRIALFRFAPSNHAYGRAYLSYPGALFHGDDDSLTDAERAVLSTALQSSS